jgi:hypothetical protein
LKTTTKKNNTIDNRPNLDKGGEVLEKTHKQDARYDSGVEKENMREKNMRSDVIDFDLSAPRNWYFEQMVFIEKKSNVLNGDYHSGVRF